ncbi:hypothetical protein JB92DRAFT_582386 [Gautieria morchelliformis]|nr:hypothetical protein JB92DRAFT_582386 [Gautieria morchelliformis]
MNTLFTDPPDQIVLSPSSLQRSQIQEFPDLYEAPYQNGRSKTGPRYSMWMSSFLEVPTGVKNLAALIAHNKENADLELIPPYYTLQSYISEAKEVNASYFEVLAADEDLGCTRGIDGALHKFNLDALLLPTDGITSTPAAIAGYPVVTVPLGFQPYTVVPTPANPIIDNAPGIPFGISFMGTAFSEFKLISYVFACEQQTNNWLKRVAFPAAIPKPQLKDVIGSCEN